MYSKKGQISTEFLFAIGIIIIIFLFLLYLSFDKTKEINEVEKYLEKKAECFKIANLISGVFTLGSGTEKASKTSFQIHVKNNSFIEVQRIGHTQRENSVECRYSAITLEKNFTGSFTVTNENNLVVIKK